MQPKWRVKTQNRAGARVGGLPQERTWTGGESQHQAQSGQTTAAWCSGALKGHADWPPALEIPWAGHLAQAACKCCAGPVLTRPTASVSSPQEPVQCKRSRILIPAARPIGSHTREDRKQTKAEPAKRHAQRRGMHGTASTGLPSWCQKKTSSTHYSGMGLRTNLVLFLQRCKRNLGIFVMAL